VLGLVPERADAEPPPETQKLTLLQRSILCNAAVRRGGVAVRRRFRRGPLRQEPLERAEHALTLGEADISMVYAPSAVTRIEAGDTIVLVAGVHVGVASRCSGMIAFA
jgi:NitT/TauT family transport system substrate-binding protein